MPKTSSSRYTDKNNLKPIRPMNRNRIYYKALYYLERYNASERKLYDILQQFINRNPHPDNDEAVINAWRDDVIEHMRRLHYIDDAKLAAHLIRQCHAKNMGYYKIKQILEQKMINADIIEQSCEDLRDHYNNIDADDADHPMQQLLAFAKKKHIGPYRHVIDDDASPTDYYKLKQREIGQMQRRGFSYELIQQLYRMMP